MDDAKLIEAAKNYFDVWNAHDGAGVAKAFAPNGTLRDWDQEVSGAEAVGEANAGIFKAVKDIKIEVISSHPSSSTSTVTCEILVHLNNDAKEVLKVVDVITYNADGLITSLRAYKG